jgi:glyoxylase-like metal-dependent hydrolase (beta-lactamase superfamily II)
MPDTWQIDGLVDTCLRLRPDRLYREWDGPTDGILLSVGAFALRGADDRVVLVDAGAGESFPLPEGLGEVTVSGLLPQALADIGITPTDVGDVVLSHLHHDHVGWARLFTRATFRCHEREVVDDPRVAAALGPVRDRVRRWSHDCELAPGLMLWHTPGHTAGSSCLQVETPSGPTVLVGDVVHHPLEFGAALTGPGDADPADARATRQWVAERVRAAAATVRGPHFPDLAADVRLEAE